MNNNYLGISAIVLGTICFSVNDISVKLFSSEMPLNQLMFFRAIFAISILLFVILPFYGGFKYLNTNTSHNLIIFDLHPRLNQRIGRGGVDRKFSKKKITVILPLHQIPDKGKPPPPSN